MTIFASSGSPSLSQILSQPARAKLAYKRWTFSNFQIDLGRPGFIVSQPLDTCGNFAENMNHISRVLFAIVLLFQFSFVVRASSGYTFEGLLPRAETVFIGRITSH